MGALLLDEQTAPGTPSTGQVVMYPKADGFLYSKDDAGTETQLAAPASGPTLGTPQATTSGTSFDFTGIPSGTKRIVIMLSGVSTSGTDDLYVQIGDSGGIETTSYDSVSAAAINSGATVVGSYTTAFGLKIGSASAAISGTITLTLINASTFSWVATHALKTISTVGISGGGSKSLSAELDRVRLTRSGSDTFDAGTVNILYE